MAEFSTSDTVAGQPAEQLLVGTWYLTSYALRNREGEIFNPLGLHPQGQIIYDAIGNMSCHLLNPDPPARPTDAKDGIAYEGRVSYERYSSYYGRYEIDCVARTVHHHVVGALMPGWAGTTVTRNYVFEGEDELTLSAVTGADGQQAILHWRRAG